VNHSRPNPSRVARVVQQSVPGATTTPIKRLESSGAARHTLRSCLYAAASASVMLALVLMSPASATAWSRDRTAPTQPAALQVTSLGAYHVSLAWGASRDFSGIASYRLGISDGRELSVRPGTTSVRVGWGLTPTSSYSFWVVAVDAAGNRSRASNVVDATLPADVTPPTTPVLSLGYAASSSIAVSFTAARDDGPRVHYEISIDGSPVLTNVLGTSATLSNLAPDTSYSLQVRARDPYGNASAPSAALTVSTRSLDGSDRTPPSTPGRFAAFDDCCGDIFLVWDESMDDRDARSVITYEVYVDGSLQGRVQGRGWAAFNLSNLGLTHFEVVAVDAAGNRSLPAFDTLELDGDC